MFSCLERSRLPFFSLLRCQTEEKGRTRMKCRQFALLISLGVASRLPLAAQVLPAGTASNSGPQMESLFPALLTGTHQGLELTPAVSKGLRIAAGPEPDMPARLTGKERLILFWNETYATPGLWVGVAGGAMVDQVRHTPLKWDSDGNGYTRRFASEYGQLALRNGIHDGLDGVSGLDPRYAVCKGQGMFRRSAHAFISSFIADRPDGRLILDMPSIAGAYGAGMVSTFWYPHQQFNPLVQGVQFGHEQMGEIALGNLMREFSHDIQRRLHLHVLTARRVANPDDD